MPASPRLLIELRDYWRIYNPSILLFPGNRPDRPYNHTSILKAVKHSASVAKLRKRISPHTLRHSYATGLLEAGVDLLTISKLLGHASFVTTTIYLHCRREHMISPPSPLDWLPMQQLPTYQRPAENGKPESSDSPSSEPENSQPQNKPPGKSAE